MAMILTYGNKPPIRSRILLGEQVRPEDWRAISDLNTEMWANAGENLGGMAYDRQTIGTASTLYNVGSSGWQLDRWQPISTLAYRHNVSANSTVFFDAYVRNLNMRLYVLNSAYTVLFTLAVSCTSNTPQWISIRAVLTGLNVGNVRLFQTQMARNTYAGDGELYHFGAKMGATLTTQIPIT